MATKSLSKSFMTPSLFNDFFKPWNEWLSEGSTWEKVMTVPAVNVSEKDGFYQVELAAPGLSKEDFDINVEGNMLNISSEKEETKEEKEDKYTRKEYNYSSFSRSFTMPEDVRQEAIEATYENGVLNIRLPKIETPKKGTLQKTIAVR